MATSSAEASHGQKLHTLLHERLRRDGHMSLDDYPFAHEDVQIPVKMLAGEILGGSKGGIIFEKRRDFVRFSYAQTLGPGRRGLAAEEIRKYNEARAALQEYTGHAVFEPLAGAHDVAKFVLHTAGKMFYDVVGPYEEGQAQGTVKITQNVFTGDIVAFNEDGVPTILDEDYERLERLLGDYDSSLTVYSWVPSQDVPGDF